MTNLTKELIEIDNEYVLHTYNRFPMVITHGKGCFIFDSDGNKYLDMIAGIAVNMLGYGDDILAEAIGEQAKKLMHTSNLFYTAPQSLLAKKLVELSGMKKAFFCNSGAEANEAALKIAKKAAKQEDNPTKTQIISATNSFHGRTLGAITATGQVKYQKSFTPLIPGFDYIEYNNISQLEEIMSENTCAVIMEPIQGESGVHPAQKDFLLKTRELCDKYKAALIFDEVQTGMGRTGKTFAFEHFGVKPDILTLAKMLGAGFPIGACLASENYADVFCPGDHASTFGGNPLAATAALVTISRMEELKLVENSAQIGAYLIEKLSKIKGIKEIRGIGLMIGIELENPNAKEILSKGFEEGIIINAIGDNIIRLVPPLVISKEEADMALKILSKIIS